MATLKQCLYIAEQNSDALITVYYIDLRAPGRYVNVLEKVKALPNVRFVKGKVADAVQAEGDTVRITVEDAVRGEKLTLDYDLVVLATGMQPSLAGENPPLPLPLDEDGLHCGRRGGRHLRRRMRAHASGCDALRAVRHSRRPEGGANGEREVGGMAGKIGVYFDLQNIGGGLDVEALAAQLREKWGDLTPVVKVCPVLAESVDEIQADIEAQGLDGVLLCGASPRVDAGLYRFPVQVEHVNPA